MPHPLRPHIRLPLYALVCAGVLTACSTGSGPSGPTPGASSTPPTAAPTTTGRSPSAAPTTTAPPSRRFTISFTGDIHFEDRTAQRLAADPATVFGQAEPGLAKADLTVANLETAITTRGTPQAKEYHFRTNPTALTALRDGGIDVATMANNHSADYGAVGLADTLAAIKSSGFPVVGIGEDADAAYAPYTTTIRGAKIAIFGADALWDETTLRLFSAGPDKPGVANARDAGADRLVAAVKRYADKGYVVIPFLHWGVEDDNCANSEQAELAGRLAKAGATAIIGDHPHVLQGAGWRSDGVYVAYSMGNFLWWGGGTPNEDPTGLLTLTIDRGSVVQARFAPAKVDKRGVPVPATGTTKSAVLKVWDDARACTDLSSTPPS